MRPLKKRMLPSIRQSERAERMGGAESPSSACWAAIKIGSSREDLERAEENSVSISFTKRESGRRVVIGFSSILEK